MPHRSWRYGRIPEPAAQTHPGAFAEPCSNARSGPGQPDFLLPATPRRQTGTQTLPPLMHRPTDGRADRRPPRPGPRPPPAASPANPVAQASSNPPVHRGSWHFEQAADAVGFATIRGIDAVKSSLTAPPPEARLSRGEGRCQFPDDVGQCLAAHGRKEGEREERVGHAGVVAQAHRDVVGA